MEIITRADLGWPNTPATPRRTDTGLVIHYDGGAPGEERVTLAQPCSACRAYWRWCRSFHMGPKRQWLDVGYSAFVCPHGNLYIGRDYGYEQAAQPGGNQTWASVTTGLVIGQSPTTAQINGIRRVRRMWMDKGMHGTVACHSNFISTSCPGDALRRLVKQGVFSKAPDDNWTDDLMQNLPTISEGTDNFYVKSVRALLIARGHAKDIDRGILREWINNTKWDRELTRIFTDFQREAFPKLPREWDGICGEKSWTALNTP